MARLVVVGEACKHNGIASTWGAAGDQRMIARYSLIGSGVEVVSIETDGSRPPPEGGAWRWPRIAILPSLT